jgi:hypothetical protein
MIAVSCSGLAGGEDQLAGGRLATRRTAGCRRSPYACPGGALGPDTKPANEKPPPCEACVTTEYDPLWQRKGVLWKLLGVSAKGFAQVDSQYLGLPCFVCPDLAACWVLWQEGIA